MKYVEIGVRSEEEDSPTDVSNQSIRLDYNNKSEHSTTNKLNAIERNSHCVQHNSSCSANDEQISIVIPPSSKPCENKSQKLKW